jgi:NADPH:quinone reductase-like Zn-dependent oxidoreductase
MSTMSKAVRFDEYGGIDVLQVVEVPDPVPGPGEVLVRVKAAGINPGEASIREGLLHKLWPATFPSGQGSDLAGVVEAAEESVGAWRPGDEVLGWTDRRASHAELVVTAADQLIAKPQAVPWEVAGALFVAGTTARASVRAIAPQGGETVVVTAAAGGVGSLTVQLARRTGARVIGLASEANHDWLRAHDVIPVTYGDGVAERIRAEAPDGVDAFVDTFGGYLDLALVDLGVAPERVNTIIPPEQRDGVKSEGNNQGASTEALSELAGLIAAGDLELPIARTYPLSDVREAYTELARRHTRGKIVLIP